ncbi:hypothetical protein ZOSMA_18G00150 [Zostera marina]|uniref:Uncharacterized protein n=1 Tax=Zostera marina TaxID=29655 RepID=A0A0K9PRS1_ZOSMR|nr:hypothetical protein ZOSMA_18G00150 [Zostera marina]
MGAQSSKRSGETHPVFHEHISMPLPTIDITKNTTITSTSAGGTSRSPGAKMQFKAELSSYKTECLRDPTIQSFDTTLQRSMSRAISSLAVGVEVRSLSLDSLKEVTGCLLDMNQEVVKIILDCKKDIWKNPELFDLVEEYFDNSLQTLDFCTVLEKCLKKARDTQLIVHVALQKFSEEEKDGNKYRQTLSELNNFKAAGDPFTEDFFQQFQSVYTHQLSMLEKLRSKNTKLGKKLKSIKAWRKISSIIFISAFVAVLICSVVAAAMSAPPLVAALIAAISVPAGSMGKWVDSLWKVYSDALKAQKEIVHTMQVGSYVAIKDMDNIRILVDRLQIQIDGMIRNVDFTADREDESVRFVVDEIKKKLGLFTKNIQELEEQADRCTRDIRKARTVVLQRIIKHPS